MHETHSLTDPLTGVTAIASKHKVTRVTKVKFAKRGQSNKKNFFFLTLSERGGGHTSKKQVMLVMIHHRQFVWIFRQILG